jgi:hypothetical protein
MIKVSILAASLLLTSAAIAQTTDATVCKTATYPLLTTPASAVINDKMEYVCGNGQQGTIPSLAKLGWHIVSFQQHSESGASANQLAVFIMVIEKSIK